MSTAVVVVAAGSGERLGTTEPKAFVELAGRPLVVHAALRVLASGVTDRIVIVVPPDRLVSARHIVAREPGLASADVVVVTGGATRRESVAAGLAAIGEDCDVVLVHDAARCLATPRTVAAVVAAVRGGADAVVPVVPVADTIKRVADGTVAATLDRDELVVTQTPQGFRRSVLAAAHARAEDPGAPSTDDAVMVERAGVPVAVVAGSPEAFKITVPLDLVLAEAVLRRGPGAPADAGPAGSAGAPAGARA